MPLRWATREFLRGAASMTLPELINKALRLAKARPRI
jgi:hypothetical protein